MKAIILVFLLLPAIAGATGYSGLNNELAWMYGIIIGFLLIPVLISYLVKYISVKKKIKSANDERIITH